MKAKYIHSGKRGLAYMGYKSTDGLMRHLRNNGINISGSKHKKQLINTGYFHGYKGYRFFKNSGRRIPFSSYDEIYATIQYDTSLKSLMYAKIMFIETAIKNISLNCILKEVGSESIQDMLDIAVCGYSNSPTGATIKQKEENQSRKLSLQATIQSYLARAYRNNNPKIAHFYNSMSYSGVPIWALFEIMTMGDFGFLLQCLTKDVREVISIELGLNLACDTNRELVYKYIYALRDLRNAVAHNGVVFDTRFSKIKLSKAMTQCLILEFNLPYVNFKSIGDYIILICYFLKLLNMSKTEIKAFIRDFERVKNIYVSAVNTSVSSIVIHPDISSRLQHIKNYI